jgi:ArsR family transcriptional regulator
MDHPDAVFKALSDPIRLRILEFLRRPDAECCSVEDRVCACDLEGLLGLSQPTVSHHMKILVQAGLVASEKSGRWVYYRVDRPAFAAAITYLARFAGDELPAETVQAVAPPENPCAVIRPNSGRSRSGNLAAETIAAPAKSAGRPAAKRAN